MKRLAFERPFQVWTYTVSHGQLLLRSTKSAQTKTQVDVLFKNVALINVTSSLDGLTILEAAPGEILLDHADILLKGRKIFRIIAKNFSGYVVAGVVTSHEDEGEYSDPSALMPR